MPVLIRYGQTVLRISTVLPWNLNYFSTLYRDIILTNVGFSTTNLSVFVECAKRY